MAPNSNTKKKTDGQQAPPSGGALKRALAVGPRLLDIIEPAWRNSDAIPESQANKRRKLL